VHSQEESAGVHSDPANTTDLPPEKFSNDSGKKKKPSRLLDPRIAGSILEPSEGPMSVGIQLPFLVYRTERT